MAETHDVVYLFDVDNTLLDNDTVAGELRAQLDAAVGADCGRRYWAIFEALRAELGYADYLGAFQRYRVENPHEPQLPLLTTWLISYPFPDRLYPGAREVLAHCRAHGPVVILSDGDVVFQPWKVRRSGIWDAVDDVLIYVHKEDMLDDVEARWPARHYVVVDDKVRILAALRAAWGARVTTVFPRQGHYATDAALLARHPAPDVTLEAIGELRAWDAAALRAAARAG